MIVEKITVDNGFETNVYFYIDEKTKHGFLIDPAYDAKLLLETIKNHDWIIEKILITHGHVDHIAATEEVSKTLNIPYYIHKNSKEYLSDPSLNLSAFFGGNINLNDAIYFDDGDEISLSAAPEIKLKVIHTPGHTQDSCVFYDEKNGALFSGDTIFRGAFGRTDFPGSDLKQMLHNINEKIFTLPGETIIYSGHTRETTVEREKNRYA